MFKTENYYHLEYIGEAGITQTCLISLCNLIQVNPDLNYALLLTNQQTHAFILRNSTDSYYIIRSGFTSGYPGEGPKGLATALVLLNKHYIETEEILITAKMMNKLNNSSLSDGDIDFIFKQKNYSTYPITRIYLSFQKEISETSSLKRYYPLEFPYSIIDERIFDLALLFKNDPDSALLKAYKRLEDIVRTRTGLSEHSSKLFSQAFLPPKACLTWKLPDNSEIDGRANLFTNTYKAFRNARTHREKDENQIHQFREFLLVNELYLLEKEAIPLELED